MIILAPHLGKPINEITHSIEDLGEVETMRAWKEMQSAAERKGLKGPGKVSSTQMWVDLKKGEGSKGVSRWTAQ